MYKPPLLWQHASISPSHSLQLQSYHVPILVWSHFVVHLINWAMLIIIIACVVKNRKNVKKSKLKWRLFLILIIGVWIRLGVLIFWQLALNKETDFTFKILFSIFISSQGLLIFLIHVIHAPQSGKQWKKLLIKFYILSEVPPCVMLRLPA